MWKKKGIANAMLFLCFAKLLYHDSFFIITELNDEYSSDNIAGCSVSDNGDGPGGDTWKSMADQIRNTNGWAV